VEDDTKDKSRVFGIKIKLPTGYRKTTGFDIRGDLPAPRAMGLNRRRTAGQSSVGAPILGKRGGAPLTNDGDNGRLAG